MHVWFVPTRWRRVAGFLILILILTLSLGATALAIAPAIDEPPASDDPLPALEPLRDLIGSWKGLGIPTTDRLRGWPETHAWAWGFEKGRPTSVTVDLQGNTVIRSGRMTPVPDTAGFRLDGLDPEGRAVVYTGGIEPATRILTLDRVDAAPAGGRRERLVLRLTSNRIRYTLGYDVREPGAPQYDRVVETGLTRAGESFASGGGSGAGVVECIITGGAATLSVSHNGTSYPICCTGCRDEFLADPEKYVRKAAERQAAQAASKEPAPPVRRSRDSAFEGLLGDASGESAPAPARPSTTPEQNPTPEPAPEPMPEPEPSADIEARARTNLRLGQSLERSGKTAAALEYYKRVVEEAPESEPARIAAGRITAIEGMP